jgi:hypothetical protein
MDQRSSIRRFCKCTLEFTRGSCSRPKVKDRKTIPSFMWRHDTTITPVALGKMLEERQFFLFAAMPCKAVHGSMISMCVTRIPVLLSQPTEGK